VVYGLVDMAMAAAWAMFGVPRKRSRFSSPFRMTSVSLG
jgi:hypothetical protein